MSDSPLKDGAHEREVDLFERACDLPPAEQDAFLDRECAGDGLLRARVAHLLARDAAHGTDLDRPAAAALAGPPAAHETPQRLGGYTILGELGRGGMGVVYLAEQESPRRKVALKVLQPGILDPGHLRRFEHEALALGWLNHPGIAQIYEAGVARTPRGPEPFLAMEWVQGEPLTRYAERSGLSVRERLELVARICDAVEHAHQKGVIHRDLKPGNILVDASGQPKVLDFGVARVAAADRQATTLRTRAGEIVGTLAYMSPEQLSGRPQDIDTRSDVYALGLIAWELLAGRMPYDLEGKSLPEATRVLLESEPARLSSVRRELRGDVATIVGKAVAKEKERRYASARELAGDLRRTLRHEPILARPSSGFYQLRKFARRNKGLTAGVALAALALVAATIVSLVQVRVANTARDEAGRERVLALRAACRAAIAAATVAAEHADFATCRRLLDSVAPGDRNWEWRHLAARADRTLVRVDGSEPFLDAVLVPSAEELIAVTRSGTVRRWRLPALQPLAAQPLDEVPSGPAAFRRDGGALAAVLGPERNRVGIFDLATGRLTAQVTAAEPRLPRLAFAPDGTQVAFGGRDAWLWDPASGAAPVQLHGRHFKALGFSGDSLRLASGFGPPPVGAGYFLAYDARTGAPIGAAHHDSYQPIADLALDADGTRLAVAYGDKRIRLVDVGAGRVLDRLDGHRGAVRCVAFDPSGQRLASAADDETLRLWQLGTGAGVAVLGGLPGQPLDLAFGVDGARVLARTERAIALWSTDAGHEVLRGHRSYVYGVAFTGGGARIVSASYESTLRIWDADSGEPLWERKFNRDGAQGLTAAAAAPVFASVHNSGVRLWDADAGEVIRTFETVQEAGVVDAALAADGSLLAVRGEAAVILWDTSTGEVVHRWSIPSPTPYRAVAIAPGGERVAAESERGLILLWDVASGAEIAQLVGHSGPVEGLAFSADGSLLASGGVDRTVRLWDGHTGAPRWTATGHTDRVFALAFAPDGSRLVSASGDHTLRVWDAEPMRSRWPAAERARQLRAQAGPAVRALLASEPAPARAAQRLRADPALDPLQREAAIQALLRLTGGLAPPK